MSEHSTDSIHACLVVVTDQLAALSERLERVESTLQTLVDQRTIKDYYGVDEVAKMLGKAEFTVREYCRLGRLRAIKRRSGRGKHLAWVVPHEELLRFQREGLLPVTFSA
jgi:hypothetical protein